MSCIEEELHIIERVISATMNDVIPTCPFLSSGRPWLSSSRPIFCHDKAS